jgi:exonuclease VII small subunit
MKLYENRDALARQLEEAIQNVYMIQGAQQAVNQLIKEYEENTTTETTTED